MTTRKFLITECEHQTGYLQALFTAEGTISIDNHCPVSKLTTEPSSKWIWCLSLLDTARTLHELHVCEPYRKIDVTNTSVLSQKSVGVKILTGVLITCMQCVCVSMFRHNHHDPDCRRPATTNCRANVKNRFCSAAAVDQRIFRLTFFRTLIAIGFSVFYALCSIDKSLHCRWQCLVKAITCKQKASSYQLFVFSTCM